MPTTGWMARLRSSPETVFSIVSLLVMVALALMLGSALQKRINTRALGDATQIAKMLGALEIHPTIAPHELHSELSKRTFERLHSNMPAAAMQGSGVVGVKIFDNRRRLIWSLDGETSMRPAPPASNVARAMRGITVKSLTRGTADDGRGSQTLSVYAPLRYGPSGTPEGAFEVYLDYGPVAAAARSDVLAMWARLGGGLLFLWLTLFGLVRSVARALRRQLAANRRQSTHDALTGLPNRVLLQERLREAIDGDGAALLLLDLDRFKEVNDTLGHDHGDQLLVEVAARLRAVAAEDDIVARMGGDEFAVLRPTAADEAEAHQLAARLAEAVRAPLDLGGTTIVMDASVGVALCPEHGDDPVTLVRLADVAMYAAKARHSEVETYDPASDVNHRDRLELLGELPRAMRRGELVLAYQPKLSLVTGEPDGVEALVRWNHPERGLLMPGAFIPAAEVTSLASPLTLYVLDAALRQHRAWRDEGLYLPVAVNLAGPSVVDDELPEAVGALLRVHGVDPVAVTLEISEQTMMSDIARAKRVLDAFRGLGVRLSLDDFGTGQTSLGQLLELPLQELKIDRSLVGGDERLASSITEMAHRLGLAAVAEGVEDEATAASLRAAGCDHAQGFLYARPMWPADLVAWLDARGESARRAA